MLILCLNLTSEAAFFGALPNPLNVFSPDPGSTEIKAGEILWSAGESQEFGMGSFGWCGYGRCFAILLKGTTWKGTIVTAGGGFAGIRTQPIKPAFNVTSCTGFGKFVSRVEMVNVSNWSFEIHMIGMALRGAMNSIPKRCCLPWMES